MTIPMYAVEAHSGNIISIDDDTVVKDQAALNGSGGSAFVAFLKSVVFDQELDGGYSRFRRAVQHVHADGAVTIDFVPYRDQNESGSSIQQTLAVGDSAIVTANLNESGTNFNVKVSLSAFDAKVELGKAEQFVVPRRTAL